MADPIVSLIVPVYRTPEPLLAAFLQSARAQTLAALQIILVDDASPDACPRLLDAAGVADARVRVLHRAANGGTSAARNDGLAAATGEFVLFADADDRLQPDLCATLADVAQRQGADVVACAWDRIDAQGNPRGRGTYQGRRYNLAHERERMACLEALNYALWNKLFRRAVLRDLRFETFDVNVGEDVLFLVQAVCRATVAVTTPYCGYAYTGHSASTTGRPVKGMAHLRALARSAAGLHAALDGSGGAATRRFADRLALKRFATGCAWIAATPAGAARAALWSQWQAHFRNDLFPRLHHCGPLAPWCALSVALAGPEHADRLIRTACRLAAPGARRDRRETNG